MTSREIAELTGKRPADVMRDIRVMLVALGLDERSFASMSPDSYGRPQQMFSLPKDLTITLVSGYSIPMRHKIVTRWMGLEFTQRSFALSATPTDCVGVTYSQDSKGRRTVLPPRSPSSGS